MEQEIGNPVVARSPTAVILLIGMIRIKSDQILSRPAKTCRLVAEHLVSFL